MLFNSNLFTFQHQLFTVIGITAVILLIIAFRKITKEKVEKLVCINFGIVFIFEIIKIIWNFVYRENLVFDNWVPLYYCSMFIYASGLFTIGKYFKKDKLKSIGTIIMVYGQIIGGIAFIIYPSTSLPMFPIWHFLSIHSLIYHVIITYTGILLIINYIPEKNKMAFKRDFYVFFIVMMIVTIIVFIFNIITKSNIMFINDTGGIAALELIKKVFKDSYSFIIAFGQIIGSFIFSSLIIFLHQKIKK